MKIKSVSKVKLKNYNNCPLMTWKDLRSNKPYEENVDLQIGILAHELAKQKLAQSIDIRYEVHNIEERFPLTVIDKVLSIIEKKDIASYYKDLQVIGIEEPIIIPMENMGENFMLSIRLNVVSFTEIDDQRYIVVDDFKSGQAIKRESDIESIIYSYAAYEQYGQLPVIFRRIALSSNLIFTETFSVERIERLKPFINFKIKEFKEDMESDMLPNYTPGSHCIYCNHIHNCQGRKDISSLQNKYKAAIWAKMYAKRYETEVKNAAADLMQYIPVDPDREEETVLLPFLNGRYGAVAKTTESYQLKGRLVTKKDILNVLIETGEIENYIDNIDIKFDENLSKMLSEDYKIPMKKVVKQVVSLVENNGENNGFE